MKKKIIIVNNNMKVGGVQKSLYNLLWTIDAEQRYDITLLLFSGTGSYMEKLPESVKVVECRGAFRYLGISQDECRGSLKDTVVRGCLAAVSRLLGRDAAIRLMLSGQPAVRERYDCAAAFLQNGRKNSFYGGVQDFVLHCIQADRKVAFLHCDYQKCGANHAGNNRLMERFDQIAVCSEGCGRVFKSVLPGLAAKCTTVRNCHRFDEIRELSEQDPYVYDPESVNVVMVARLSHEKGIDRAIEAAEAASGKGLQINLHIIGDGSMRDALEARVNQSAMRDHIIFYGEQPNPYRFMKNADLLLLTSYHEAAPMVIDEARCLGLPVLTTETTSSREMVTDMECGWVCGNAQEEINTELIRLVSDKKLLADCKKTILQKTADNTMAYAQFRALVEN